MSEVFLSHVEEDATIALEIAIRLEAAGYSTWCYEVDSVPGPSYLLQTGRAIEQAQVFLLLISSHSLGSRQVTQEIVRAHESGKSFLPVLCDVTHDDFQHRQQEWREAVGAATSIVLPTQGVSAILPRLLSGLEALGRLPGALPDEARMTALRQALADRQQHAQSTAGKPGLFPSPPRPAPHPQPGFSSTATTALAPRTRWKRWGWFAVILCIAMGVLFIFHSGLFPPKEAELSTTSRPVSSSTSPTRQSPSLPSSQNITTSSSASTIVPPQAAQGTPQEPMATGAGQIRATMRLTPDGPVLNGYWRVYKAEGYELGERQQVTYSAEGQFTLSVGRYVLEATYGDAAQSKGVEVRPGQITTTEIILNAGQLRGTARLSAHGAPVNGYWRVYKAEGYELGERQQVTYSAEARFTLPAGRYVVEVERVETKGHAKVTVQAGEISNVDIVLGAAS